MKYVLSKYQQYLMTALVPAVIFQTFKLLKLFKLQGTELSSVDCKYNNMQHIIIVFANKTCANRNDPEL